MRVEVFRDWEAAHGLADEWNGLLADSRADSLFLTWEWMSAWKQVWGEAVRPLVVAVRDKAGRLAGIVPCYLAGFRAFRGLRVRALRVLGDSESGSEYSDWILRADCERETADVAAGTLRDLSSEWDFLWMPNMRGWGGSRECISDALAAAGLGCRVREREFSYLDLPRRADEVRARLTSNRREQLRRQEAALERVPGLRLRICSSADELPAFLDGLFDLNARRWASVGKAGTFVRKPREEQFYRVFAPKAFGRGWLLLFALEEAGRLRAVQFGYGYGNVYHQLQEGFDPDFVPGVGNVLRLRVMEELVSQGVAGYDFLGGTSEHKRRWGAKVRTGWDMMATSCRMAGRLLRHLAIWPTGRYLRPVVPA